MKSPKRKQGWKENSRFLETGFNFFEQKLILIIERRNIDRMENREKWGYISRMKERDIVKILIRNNSQ